MEDLMKYFHWTRNKYIFHDFIYQLGTSNSLNPLQINCCLVISLGFFLFQIEDDWPRLSNVKSRHQTRLGRSVSANLSTATSVCQAAVRAWGGAGAGCAGAGGGLSTAPHAFSSVNTSVKKPGSELILSMLKDSLSTISRHRSQNLSLESSTRKGLSGYEISLPM